MFTFIPLKNPTTFRKVLFKCVKPFMSWATHIMSTGSSVLGRSVEQWARTSLSVWDYEQDLGFLRERIPLQSAFLPNLVIWLLVPILENLDFLFCKEVSGVLISIASGFGFGRRNTECISVHIMWASRHKAWGRVTCETRGPMLLPI